MEKKAPNPFEDVVPAELLPKNISVGENTIITGARSFERFRSDVTPALTIGKNCTMLGVSFSLGPSATMSIGDDCYFTNVMLLSEESLVIGSHVVIGWNSTVSDADFHPLSPALRIQDALALAPHPSAERPPFVTKPVMIEDDVWIGPGVTVLKGVRLHRGAWIEPGSVVLKDVPAGARAFGNPARFE
jgi:acetyltransferase-like isoleucine patch superfamily enzyme